MEFEIELHCHQRHLHLSSAVHKVQRGMQASCLYKLMLQVRERSLTNKEKQKDRRLSFGSLLGVEQTCEISPFNK